MKFKGYFEIKFRFVFIQMQSKPFYLFFIQVIYPPCLIVTSIVTNILVICVYSRKKFHKLPTRNVWRLISFVDLFSSLQLTKHFLNNTFGFNVYLSSGPMCKILNFLSYSNSIAAWLLVYISSERFLAIHFSRISRKLHKFQPFICVGIFLYNVILYSQDLLYIDLFDADNSTECYYLPEYETAYLVFAWVDLFNASVIPFVLMFILSILLTVYIFASRKKMAKRLSIKGSRNYCRDIKFSITLIFLNVFFITFTLPITLCFMTDICGSDLVYSILDDVYYTAFALNFFIYLAVNNVFRNEFRVMLHIYW